MRLLFIPRMCLASLVVVITPYLALREAGSIIPPLPEKNVVEKYKLTDEFVEQRRAALAVFMNRIVSEWCDRTVFQA